MQKKKDIEEIKNKRYRHIKISDFKKGRKIKKDRERQRKKER